MTVNAQDIELLEMYLDHELDEGEARALDQRLAGDVLLQQALERLRGGRALRLEAMSRSFDSDAASIERLVASVRMAQASEALALRRKMSFPIRSVFAAAACVAFGLLLGVVIQRQQAPNGLIASPGISSTSSLIGSPANFESHGAYIVTISSGGREVMKVRFADPSHAKQFVDSINRQMAGGPTPTLGDATMVQEEPY